MELFNWLRYWRKPDMQSNLDHNGFLASPGRESHLEPMDQLEQLKCLVLLGDPGMGKTTCLWAEYKRMVAVAPELRPEWIDCRAFNSGEQFQRAIEQFPQWQAKSAAKPFYLFLDEFDQGRLYMPNLPYLLEHFLSHSDIDGLHVRIICRSADWPQSLEQKLTNLFEKEHEATGSQVAVRVLERLTEGDVLYAANAHLLDGKAFLDAVIQKHAGALAAKPVTLNMLLRTWSRSLQEGLPPPSRFPESQSDLYEHGCLELCETSPEKRKDSAYDGRLQGEEPTKLLRVAGRMAAVMKFANRATIFRGSLVDATEQDVLTADLVGGTETSSSIAGLAPGESFAVTPALIDFTLKTGLFEVRAGGRFGWVHQTYAEYLAARYLTDAPLPQVKSLFIHPDGTGLVPQLRQTAAWLAELRQDVFNWLLAFEPDSLLSSESTWEIDSRRGRLVERLLALLSSGNLGGIYEYRPYFRQIQCSMLTDQLAAFLKNASNSEESRQIAVELAISVKDRGLAEALADISLDQKEPYELRCRASDAVRYLGVEEQRRRLEPVARGDTGDDPDGHLRATGLYCMWPKYWTTRELLRVLTEGSDPGYAPDYWSFVQNKVMSSVPDEDLAETFVTISGWPAGMKDCIWESLLLRICKSWRFERLFETAVDSLFDYVLKHKRGYATNSLRHRLESWMEQDAEGIQHIITTLVRRCGSDSSAPKQMIETGVVSAKEALLMLKLLPKLTSEEQCVWAPLMEQLLLPERSWEWADALVTAGRSVPALEALIQDIFPTGRSKSPEGRKPRSTRVWERVPLKKPAAMLTAHALDRAENGRGDRWIRACQRMACLRTKGSGLWSFPHDLTQTPVWQSADPSFRRRIVGTAFSYLRQFSPPDWEARNSHRYPDEWDRAAYAAFHLIVHEHEADALPEDIWVKWATTLVAYPWSIPIFDELSMEGDDKPLNEELLKRLLAAAPAATAQALRQILVGGWAAVTSHLRPCWNSDLSNLAFSLLRTGEVPSRSRIDLLRFLTDWEPDQVVESLFFELEHTSDCNHEEVFSIIQHRQQELLAALVEMSDSTTWPRVWTLLHDDRFEYSPYAQRGRFSREGHRFPDNLSEEAAADFYLYLCERFHGSTDSPRQWFNSEAGQWGQRIVESLTERGTKLACDALQRLLQAKPEQHEILVEALHKAHVNTMRCTWLPPHPARVIRLLQNPTQRYIVSEEQLMDVVLEALREIEEEVHGWLGSIGHFWNREPMKPLPEETLSNELASELARKLSKKRLFVGREVVVKPRRGSTEAHESGERLDILVQAFPEGAGDRDPQTLSVVLEVKGCYNPRLKEDLNDQLADRYLRSPQSRHGVYVVGWFRCTAWDRHADTQRWSHTPKFTLAEARAFFVEAAAAANRSRPNVCIEAFVMDLRQTRDDV